MSDQSPHAAETLGLEKILPRQMQVNLDDGTSLTLSPIKVKHIQRFIRASAPLYSTIMRAHSAAEVDIPDLLSSQVENVIEFVSVGIDKPVEWVGERNAEELANLFFAVAEVNTDFFIKRVLPGLLAKTSGLVKALNVPTQPSPTSSNA